MAAKKTKKAAKKASTKKKAPKKKAAQRPAARKVRAGFVSHTELSSSNPGATVAWAKAALGWKFGPAMPTPNGPYHMWSFGDNMGGGIRSLSSGEKPGTTPYCEATSMRAAYDKALKAGATAMMPPSEIPGGMGWIAVVSAPGGVPIGLWAQKE